MDVEETATNVGIDRASRRAMLIGCICADGSALKPFIIITRKTKEKALAELGYNSDNVELAYQTYGFIKPFYFIFKIFLFF